MKAFTKLNKSIFKCLVLAASTTVACGAFAELPKTVFQGATPGDAFIGHYVDNLPSKDSSLGMVSFYTEALKVNYCEGKFPNGFDIKKSGEGYIFSATGAVRGACNLAGCLEKVCPKGPNDINNPATVYQKSNGDWVALFSMDKDASQHPELLCSKHKDNPKAGDACVEVKLSDANLTGGGEQTKPGTGLTGTYTWQSKKNSAIQK